MIFNERMETLERKSLQELQVERLRATVKRVAERVPFYREKFEAAGVNPLEIHSLDDVASLPFTVKKDLRDNYPFGLFACDRDEVARIHGSSGTKGKPTVVG